MIKYYAVVRGYTPGIYETWDETQRQVSGYPNARYKSFKTFKDADDWFNTEVSLPDSSSAKQKSINTQAKSKTIDTSKRYHEVTIYSDGSASGNPGRGGYGVIIFKDGLKYEYSGGFKRTTNNRMELMGCIAGLEKLTDKSDVGIKTDSMYVVNSSNKGLVYDWKSNGWKKSNGKPAENIDLWERLIDLCSYHTVRFYYVKGHSGNRYNEECDKLSKNASSYNHLSEDTGYVKKHVDQLPIDISQDKINEFWQRLDEIAV